MTTAYLKKCKGKRDTVRLTLSKHLKKPKKTIIAMITLVILFLYAPDKWTTNDPGFLPHSLLHKEIFTLCCLLLKSTAPFRLSSSALP